MPRTIKHSIMARNESELHESIRSVIEHFERETGTWVVDIKYTKNTSKDLLNINTAILLGSR